MPALKICITPNCGAKVTNTAPNANRCEICYKEKRIAEGRNCQQCGRPGVAGDGSTGLCPHCLDTEELLNSKDRQYRE